MNSVFDHYMSPARQQRIAQTLARQEELRTIYWEQYDHFVERRMAWRASTMRHLFHLLPGKRILEIGAGNGSFTRALLRMTDGECPITSLVFSKAFEKPITFSDGSRADNVTIRHVEAFPGDMQDNDYDYIVAYHMLQDDIKYDVLYEMKKMLKPGGGILLYERNPWNPYYRVRMILRKVLPLAWKRPYEMISFGKLQIMSGLTDLGYTHIRAMPYDFIYSPLPEFMLWPVKQLSLILENCPLVRNFAASLYIIARKEDLAETTSSACDLSHHEMFFHKVSFVIPCHNEEMNIYPLIKSIRDFFPNYIREIIIVDDNSTDDTYEIARLIMEKDSKVQVIRRSPPNGVGRALRDGIQAAQGRYILIMDSDFLEIIPEMRNLFDSVASGADVAIGSRFSRESVLLNYPFTKIIVNRLFHMLANFLLGKQFRDISNNLKLLRSEIAKEIILESDDFAANAETGLKPIMSGYDVREVPISWINRSVSMGLSSFKILKTGPNYCRVLFRLFARRVLRKV